MLIRIISVILISVGIIIITALEIKFFVPILIGVPSYDSLDVLSGKLTAVGVCYVGKGTDGMYVEVLSKQKIHSIKIPCDKNLENKVGSQIEIRSRVIDYLIVLSSPEIWSIKVDKSEIYSYKERIKNQNSFLGWILKIMMLLIPILLYKVFKFSKLKPNSI